ncbi:MAG: hypothetical protein ACKOFV_02750 [Candidatus Nanopelagicaceae bacterium]
MRSKVKEILKDFNKEDGNVESSLAIIPLLLLFLATLQLITVVNFRNIDFANVQSQASVKSVHQVVEPSDQLISLDSGGFRNKLRLLVSSNEREMPLIFPGIAQILNGKKLRTEGAAVFEESEECSGGYLVC